MSDGASSFQLVKTSGVSSMPASRLVARQLVRQVQLGPSQTDDVSADLLAQSVGVFVLAFEPSRETHSVIGSEFDLEASRSALADSWRPHATMVEFEVFGDAHIKRLEYGIADAAINSETAISVGRESLGGPYRGGCWAVVDRDQSEDTPQPAALSSQQFESYVHPVKVIRRMVLAATPAAISPSTWDD